MSLYRNQLPQLSGDLFLTDGGLETTLVFVDGIDLPEFAAFNLLTDEAGVDHLNRYLDDYIELSRRYDAGFILESVTWRANSDWGIKMGFSAEQLEQINRKSIDMLVHLRNQHATAERPFVISGCLGPRGDGYSATVRMTEAQAQGYHREQIEVFAGTAADMVTAFTLNYPAEAIGICRAAEEAKIPAVISFTLETDGRLPNGETLQSAIEKVDDATNASAAYYMINCAHPTHFENLLTGDEPWMQRIRGIHANASCKSHEELDSSDTLDEGNPIELGELNARLKQALPLLNIFGGCCGTSHHHVDEIAKSCAPLFN